MIITSNYPTVFAKKLARRVGLYSVKSNFEYRITISDYLDDELDDHKTLAEFQQMAIASKFEDCLVAFHGKRLSAKQKTALQIIHKSTVPWLMGHVVGQLTEKINSSNDRDFVDACEMILDNLVKTGDGKDSGVKATRKLLIKLKN